MAAWRRLAVPLSQERVNLMSETTSKNTAPSEGQTPASSHSAPTSEGPSAASPNSASPAPDVVVFKDVTKSFGPPHAAKVAIQDVSFVVEDAPNIGELVTIVGPSGCGKSTLLRIIAGLKPHFPPTRGEALIFVKP